MINDQAQKLLVQQVAHELSAHQTYMGISLYFTRESLNGWAKFFHEQAVEEAGHGWKIINYLIDNDVEFALPQVGGAPTIYKSARDAVQVAQASERKVTQQFDLEWSGVRRRVHRFRSIRRSSTHRGLSPLE